MRTRTRTKVWKGIATGVCLTIPAPALGPAAVQGQRAETEDETTVPHAPMKAFEFFIGTWAHPDPERQLEVTMSWALDGRAVEWREWGAFPGSEPGVFSRGLIGWNAAAKEIVFHDFFGAGGREMMFTGRYEVREGGALQRQFTAHYGQGWNGRPAAGSQIRFRELWEPVGENGWRWSSEIEQNGEWREYQPSIVMRRKR